VRGALFILVVVGGCGLGDQRELPVAATGQLDAYRVYVQPVLAAGCASLDCHGKAGRPLRLFAKDGLRLDASLRGHDERDDELLANMAAIAALDPEETQVEDRLLLLKPLAVSAGGLHHVGGDLWADQTDPAYRCLHAWLRAGASDAMGRAVCVEAAP